MGEHRTSGVEQQTRGFNGIASDRYQACLLALQLAFGVGINHRTGTTLGIMFDTHNMGFNAQF
ncbi:hypothetical protein D3C86_1922870 [compost metagenome]